MKSSLFNRGLLVKDILLLRREPSAWVPLLILPLIFSIGIPAIILSVGPENSASRLIAGAQGFIDNFVNYGSNQFADNNTKIVWALFNYFFAPLYILFPVIFASTLGSYSFVGEKIEGTLENLLFGPVTIRQIAWSKMMSIFIPSTLASWLSVILYILSVNIFGYKLFGKVVLVNLEWTFILVLMPLVAFMALALVVLVSQRAKSVKSAQSIAIIGVIPVVGCMISQSFGLAIISPATIATICIVLLFIDIILTIILGSIKPEKLVLN